MEAYPQVQLEYTVDDKQWEQHKEKILERETWGSHLDVQLLALGLKKDIIVITAKEQCYIRFFLCICPASMHCGIFNMSPVNDMIWGWILNMLKPLVILFNGMDHYHSTKASV